MNILTKCIYSPLLLPVTKTFEETNSEDFNAKVVLYKIPFFGLY